LGLQTYYLTNSGSLRSRDTGVRCQQDLHSLEPSYWLFAGAYRSAKLVAFDLAKIDSISYAHSQSHFIAEGPWMSPK
jgi:hypothetical protein